MPITAVIPKVNIEPADVAVTTPELPQETVQNLQPTNPEAALEYEILERSGTILQVKFFNPLWVGVFVEEEYTESIDGEDVTMIRRVDTDPNHHVVKSVNIPLGPDGKADRVALKQIIMDQSRGVKYRMDVAASKLATLVENDLDDLVGASL